MKLDLRPPRRILDQFAWAALLLLPLLAALLRWRYELPMPWVYGLCAAGALIGAAQLLVPLLARPLAPAAERVVTRPVYVVLTLVTFPIGFVISQVLMALLYYLLITPIAWCFRLLKREVIGLRPDAKRASYWVVRGEPRDAKSYFKLY